MQTVKSPSSSWQDSPILQWYLGRILIPYFYFISPFEKNSIMLAILASLYLPYSLFSLVIRVAYVIGELGSKTLSAIV